MKKITGSKRALPALVLALICVSTLDATPVPVDPEQAAEATQSAPASAPPGAVATRRSADLGLSTALPLTRADDGLVAVVDAGTKSQQPPLVEPGTLILVGLGLITYGITRRLRIRKGQGGR